MLCEIRRKSKSGEFKSIKILSTSPSSFFDSGNGTFTVQNRHLCDCDGELKYLTDLELEVLIRGCELADRSAIPNHLKSQLKKIISLQRQNPDGVNLSNLRDKAWDQLPDKWIQLFKLLVSAGVIIDDRGEFQNTDMWRIGKYVYFNKFENNVALLSDGDGSNYDFFFDNYQECELIKFATNLGGKAFMVDGLDSAQWVIWFDGVVTTETLEKIRVFHTSQIEKVLRLKQIDNIKFS